MSTRQELREEIEAKLIPALLTLGFEKSAATELDHVFPFGKFIRKRSEVVDLINVQFDKRGKPKFVINFGIIPSEGVKLPWRSFSQKEAIESSAYSEGGRLYAGRLLMRWFGPSLFGHARIVEKAVNGLTEVDEWFRLKKVGPHLKIHPAIR